MCHSGLILCVRAGVCVFLFPDVLSALPTNAR